MDASEILRDAAEVAAGSRIKTHGSRERSFQCIAEFWNVYDEFKGHQLDTPRDVAQKMVLMKIARSLCGEPILDHFLDEAGYAAIAGELSQNETGACQSQSTSQMPFKR